MKPSVSVIIPAHNAEETLAEQLEALFAQDTDYNFDVIVVDNASTDGTGELITAYGERDDRVRCVYADERNTPGYARNEGAALSEAELLVFCDADDVVAPGFVDAMAKGLAAQPALMGVVDYELLNPPWLRKVRGSTAQDRLTHMDGVFPYVVSACFAIRHDAFDRAGGFDETMRFGQDGEFALRLHQAAIDVGFEPAAVVNYRLRPDARTNFRQAYNWGRARIEIRRRMVAAGIEGVGKIKWKNIIWLVRHLPGLRRRSTRVRWLVVAGDLLGEIRGPR